MYNPATAQNLHFRARFGSEAHVIVGLGLDIAEIDRIEAALARHGAPILERLYTPRRGRVLREFPREIRALRGAICRERGGDEGVGNGMAFGYTLAGY